MPPAFDTSQVSPSDAAVTLRSLRRRFNEVLTRPAVVEAPGDPLHRRPADGGLSPVEHAAWVATALPAVDRALRQVLVESNPEIDLPPVDVPAPVEGGDLDAHAVVEVLGDAADALAGTIAGVNGADWTRTGHSQDGPVTALDVGRLAVRIGVEHLRGAEQVLSPGATDGND